MTPTGNATLGHEKHIMTTTCPTCGGPRPIHRQPAKNITDELVRVVQAETTEISRLMDRGLYAEAKERLGKLRATLSS